MSWNLPREKVNLEMPISPALVAIIKMVVANTATNMGRALRIPPKKAVMTIIPAGLDDNPAAISSGTIAIESPCAMPAIGSLAHCEAISAGVIVEKAASDMVVNKIITTAIIKIIALGAVIVGCLASSESCEIVSIPV